MIWSEPRRPDNLLRAELGWAKDGFMVQQSHGSEMLKMKNFDFIPDKNVIRCNNEF